jgi:hypothetical protein
MTSRMEFTPEEWSAVAEAPLMAAARVVAAERGGTVRENLAIRRVYAAAKELRGESALLDDLVASSPSLDLEAMFGGERPPDDGNARLQAALAVVKAKATPEDADAYKGFVLAVVQTVAEANREGGFAGLGGEEVSPREQAALDELTALLEQ